MSRLPIALAALAPFLALAGGCSTVDRVMPERAPRADDTLRAIQGAHFRECPEGRSLANARIGSDNESRGVDTQDIGLVPLASDPSRAVRLRRITVQAGGAIAWHAHDGVQGMALVLSGEITEFRNTCLDPIVYRAGDVAREDAQTAHGWRNTSRYPAVILVTHVAPRS
jgi:quercetin dioxygenase-like cupin family protein